MKHFQLSFFVLGFLLWSCAELSLASAIFQLSDRIKRCRRVRFVESYDSFFNIVLCYYYLQKNLHPVVHLFTQYSENSSQKWFQSSNTAQAAGPASVADTSVGSWESALFALELLRFHYTFSIMPAVTNIWKDESFSAWIQTLVQGFRVFPR